MKTKEEYQEQIKKLKEKKEILKIKKERDTLKDEVEPSWFQQIIKKIDSLK